MKEPEDNDAFMYPEEIEDKVRALITVASDNADPGLALSLLAVAMGRILWDLKIDIFSMQRMIAQLEKTMGDPLCKDVFLKKIPRFMNKANPGAESLDDELKKLLKLN